MAISLKQWNQALEMLIEGEDCWLKVSSNSMAPVLQKGDKILILPCTTEKVFAGDIVLCQIGKMLRVHRLVGWITKDTTKMMVTCGDRLMRCDEPIGHDALRGKVVSRRRGRKETDLRIPSAILLGKLRALRGRLSFTFLDTYHSEGSDVHSNT